MARLPDVPRLVGRVSLGQAGPRDLSGLRDALDRLPSLAGLCGDLPAPLIQEQVAALGGLGDLAELLGRTLAAEPPVSLNEGGVIAPGVDPELDTAREAGTEGKNWIAGLQTRLRAETGIGSLKVGFNKVFGYYIEVTKSNLHLAPEDYHPQADPGRGRTLHHQPELKEQEEKVLTAGERRALELELAAFWSELRQRRGFGYGAGLMACGPRPTWSL